MPLATLPNNDPGNQGGGTYMGAGQQPSTEDFEDLFGPAGREVKQDPQRHKRHQRWHLPDVLKGTNSFLTDRVDGLISNATDSPFTSMILPYIRVDNPDQALTWDVWSYDEGLASRVPYESAARVLTQSKTSHSAYIVRQGLAISMEHNFMMSERGRRDFNNQLMQLVGSIQYTNDLDVHMALITAPNYERTESEKYAYNDQDPQQTLRKYVDMFGMCQKNPNGLDILVEDGKQVFKRWGASEPTFMLCNPKIGYQQNMTLEKTQYVTNGVDGIKRLKEGPELKSYRGLSVINSRLFSMEAGRQPRDLLNRRVRVAEHYKLPPMTAMEMANRTVMLYDESKDQMVGIPCKELYDHSRLPGDDSFEDIMRLDMDHQSAHPKFWDTMFFDSEKPHTPSKTTMDSFNMWCKSGTVTYNMINAMYHPLFVVRFIYAFMKDPSIFNTGTKEEIFDSIMAVDSNDMFLMFPHTTDATGMNTRTTTILENAYRKLDFGKYLSNMLKVFTLTDKQQETMNRWLQYLKNNKTFTSTGKHALYHFGEVLSFGDIGALDTHNSIESGAFIAVLSLLYASGGVGSTNRADKTELAAVKYATLLPYVADVYANMHDVDNLFAKGRAVNTTKKYSLFVIRPSIEHYMLGVVLGRGGTGELGATLWGQTELSCYDDAMHGKWGMNYKYHARAVVFNEKHLLRLWDVSFNGYTGGMGTNFVDWNDTAGVEEWKEDSVRLDEPLKSSFKDLFVLCFESDPEIDNNLSNPIAFCKGTRNTTTDPDNLHDVFRPEMDVFTNMTNAGNDARIDQYMTLMPNYKEMHNRRKVAGHAAHEGDTSVSSLSFSGTMQLVDTQTRAVLVDQQGTGHCGDSFAGVASIRAGNGSMAMGRPTPYRLM
ncbi:hypothetical protein T484DRAFT_1757105 [Baffinella frigidus]|nr:hypothetical protein T484DRAFT_1757105 [Cryptophyta sp. CCMP2293]